MKRKTRTTCSMKTLGGRRLRDEIADMNLFVLSLNYRKKVVRVLTTGKGGLSREKKKKKKSGLNLNSKKKVV